MLKLKIKKGDKVVVITGKDKGKSGEVLKVFPTQSKVLVQGINLKTKHFKPSQALPEGGRYLKELPIHISNVQILDPRLEIGVKVGYKLLADGTKVRFSRKSNEIIENVSKRDE